MKAKAIHTSKLYSGRKGSVLLEFTLVAPLLFLLLAGMIDIGMAIREQSILISGARMGARSAAKADSLSADARRDIAVASAREVISQGGLDADTYTFNVEPQNEDSSVIVRFSISRPGGSHLLLRAVDGFPSCVSAAFRAEDDVAPTALIQDQSCA